MHSSCWGIIVKIKNTVDRELKVTRIEMEVLKSKNMKDIRVARGGDKVYKDECVYCYNSPVSGSLTPQYQHIPSVCVASRFPRVVCM